MGKVHTLHITNQNKQKGTPGWVGKAALECRAAFLAVGGRLLTQMETCRARWVRGSLPRWKCAAARLVSSTASSSASPLRLRSPSE